MDFAENFTFWYQDKAASACWKTNSVTLVTVMIWFQKGSISMIIVSDNKHHDKRAVVPYLFTVFNYVKKCSEKIHKTLTFGRTWPI